MNIKKKVRYLRKFKCLFPSLTKKKINQKKNKPGEHPFFSSNKTAVKRSFIDRLFDKQKLKLIFCINESQLKNYIKFSLRYTKDNPFMGLYNLLHCRLDFIIYKLHMSKTILEARQLINHGYFFVNNLKRKSPGYNCKVGDVLSTKSVSAIDHIKSYLVGRVFFDKQFLVNSNEFIIKIQRPKYLNLETLKLIKSTFEFYI